MDRVSQKFGLKVFGSQRPQGLYLKGEGLRGLSLACQFLPGSLFRSPLQSPQRNLPLILQMKEKAEGPDSIPDPPAV